MAHPVPTVCFYHFYNINYFVLVRRDLSTLKITTFERIYYMMTAKSEVILTSFVILISSFLATALKCYDCHITSKELSINFYSFG